MRIILVNMSFVFDGGGSQVVSFRVADMLKKRGHEVFFFSTDKKPYYDENYEYTKYFPGVDGGNMKYPQRRVRYYYNFEAKKNLKEFIKLIKPDIIHIQTLGELTSSILDVCKDVPTVMSLHSVCENVCPRERLWKPNGTCFEKVECSNARFYNCLKNKCFGEKLKPNLRGTLRAYVQYWNFTSNVDYFIPVSDAIKNKFITTDKRFKKKKITTIYNFLSDDQTKNITPNYNNKGYFLFVGRLSEEKGLDDLLKAMAALPRDIELHIVGSGYAEKDLIQYISDNNLENVKLMGFKTGNELVEEYNNCMALITPSTAYEAFGLINIEAFINGKPVIASNVGGIPEVVEHNKTGLLFEYKNVEQLKECILKYKNNPDLIVEHGKNAYKKAIENYTEDIYYEKLMNVYNEVLNEYKK